MAIKVNNYRLPLLKQGIFCVIIILKIADNRISLLCTWFAV